MAVVSMMRIEGNAEEMASKLRDMGEVSRRIAPKHGGLGTIVARTDDGILAINLWRTEEGRHSMAEDPEMQEALRVASFPQPQFEGYEILHAELLPEAVEALSSG